MTQVLIFQSLQNKSFISINSNYFRYRLFSLTSHVNENLEKQYKQKYKLIFLIAYFTFSYYFYKKPVIMYDSFILETGDKSLQN